MVFMWRNIERTFVGGKRGAVLYNDNRDSDWDAVLLVCRTCILSIWKRDSVWRRGWLADREYHMAALLRNTYGGRECLPGAAALHNDSRNSIWASVL